jgi:hypothetical protein
MHGEKSWHVTHVKLQECRPEVFQILTLLFAEIGQKLEENIETCGNEYAAYHELNLLLELGSKALLDSPLLLDALHKDFHPLTSRVESP